MSSTIPSARRNGHRPTTAAAPATVVRVGIYCRQSVADDSEFGSIQAQRQAVEAFIASQAALGWQAVADEFNDHGFSGGNTERPAFQRLISAVEAGEVDHIACYKIDRLSRSISDFCRAMECFRARGVGFTSITQSFSSDTSVGQLTLNILMSFAQFERETIAERVRDKIHSSRKRGMWTGGQPPLGYVVKNKKLIVHNTEADDVRHIFDLYLQRHSLLEVATTLNEHGKRTKAHVTKAGKKTGGHSWNKNRVDSVIKNPIYVGQVKLAGDLHAGEHEAIVDQETWDAVQAQLKQSEPKKRGHRQSWTARLGGLLYCGRCGSKMYRHHTSKSTRRYASYVCAKVSKGGAQACPRSRVPAAGIEQFVVDQIRRIGRDPKLVKETLHAANAAHEERLPGLREQQSRLDQRRRHLSGEHENVVDALAACNGTGREALLDRLENIGTQLAEVDQQAHELRVEITAVGTVTVDEDDLRAALAEFDQVWNQLATAEQARVLELLLERITYDGTNEELSITFRPSGIKSLGLQSENNQ